MAKQIGTKIGFSVGALIAAAAFAVGATQGCGSSGSGSSYQDLCNQGCEKAFACEADAGQIPTGGDFDFVGSCKAMCTEQAATYAHCSNASAITSAAQACLSMSCSTLTTCLSGLPACQNGTGG